MTSTVEEETLNPRPDEGEKGSETGGVLEVGGEPVGSDKEDEELEEELEVAGEEGRRYAHLAGQGHPVVLVVEAGDHADRHQLEGEGDQADRC